MRLHQDITAFLAIAFMAVAMLLAYGCEADSKTERNMNAGGDINIYDANNNSSINEVNDNTDNDNK